MPCKISKNIKNCGNSDKSNKIKTKLACILEASESTRPRMGESLPNHHEDHIAEKGDNSLQHYDLVHICSCAPSHENSRSKGSSGQGMGKMRKFRRGTWRKSEVRKRWSMKQGWRAQEFISLMDICPLKNAELEAKHQKYKGRVVLRGDIVKDDSGSYAVFTEQGSSALQMTAAKVMDICLYPGKNGRCSKITQNSQIGMSRHLDSSTTTQMAQIMVQYGRPSRSSWAKSVWSSFGRTAMGKAIWENLLKTRVGEGSQLGMLIRTPWKGVILICVCGWHQIGWKETKHWSDLESTE